MNIVLTNDDGFDAPGLRAAHDALRRMGSVCVVAPRAERSACSHMITMRGPITVEETMNDRLGRMYVVEGSPADCVRLAAGALVEGPIDLVVAGINRGANAGVDTYYSGTVAAAREAAINGIRAIAVSHAVRTEVPIDWEAASQVTSMLVAELVNEPLPGPGFWSVNLPAPIPPDARRHVRRVPLAARPAPLIYKRAGGTDGRVIAFDYGASYWLREVPDPSDYSVIRDGGIAVTAIPLYGQF